MSTETLDKGIETNVNLAGGFGQAAPGVNIAAMTGSITTMVVTGRQMDARNAQDFAAQLQSDRIDPVNAAVSAGLQPSQRSVAPGLQVRSGEVAYDATQTISSAIPYVKPR